MTTVKTVWVCIDPARSPGDDDHIKVFDSADAAEAWMAERIPEGFAVECPVLSDGAS
ncbi:hypothetical protein [Bradyrhizobium sp.]|uniref:hypothetical protein n=1 Tax=Bradyrhizobium sp. TaxID=376 RepID=UPI001DEDC874|nr:hypothetical protein [Bradyrhizobium sp.]MBI5319650.1 hypothetical protein [Bradyrhizobium sp.]